MQEETDGEKTSGEASGALDLSGGQKTELLGVVGIGASAGGLKALQMFFEALPVDSDLAFVVVVHLAPELKSSLAELLQAQTSMPVAQVTEQVRMEPNHVYVIPPNKNLSVTDGHLSLSDLEHSRSRRAPIDAFFRTVAASHPHGIGIVFSGSGADGSVGLKAIKEAGGVVMAQLPDEAEYDSMPRNAIATGLVDFILPSRDLAVKLAAVSRDAVQIRLPHDEKALPEQDTHALQKILTHLRSRTGHDFSSYKRSTVLRRIARRMQLNHIHKLPDYLEYLRDEPGEGQALLKNLLISVTSFFRDEEAFLALENQVIPEIFAEKGREDQVRAWAVGCATGEEAYSLAMLLCEYASRMSQPPGIQVFASDLDDEALAYAREGRYPEAIVADVSEERLKRFFVKEGNGYQVKSELRDVVLFASHSLLKNPPFSRLDLVSCRNLLIYLDHDLQERIFEVFHYALRPHGYLFLGSAESAEGASELFVVEDKKSRIYQRRDPAQVIPRLPAMPLAASSRIRTPSFWPVRKIGEGFEGRKEISTAAQLHYQMLEAYAPPSILVDENFEVVHYSETAGRYMLISGGVPTRNVIKLVREELRLELRAALYQVFENKKAVGGRPVPVRLDGAAQLVQLMVRPGAEKAGTQGLALVIFNEMDAEEEARTEGDGNDPVVLRLEEELYAVRERLQTHLEEYETSNEELKASNEELQSINEEYKSTLEELETSKEELQSVNEELQTVNQELRGKIEELAESNSDLQNLMVSTDIGTLFLDRNLRIKRYTPRVADVINIMPNDRGRPIGHLTRKVDYDLLVEDLERVLRDLTPLEREIRSREGAWFLVRLRPYRTLDDRIDGIVVTFVDISAQKATEEELRQSEERYRLLVENAREYAIFIMDPEGRVITWNAGAQRLTGYSEREALGQTGDLIYVEEDRKEDPFHAEMDFAIRNGTAPDERWRRRKDGSRFWSSGVLMSLYGADGALRGFARLLRDNTRRKEAEEALRASEQQLRELNATLEERVRERTEQVRLLASNVTLAEQRERRRIAIILHDHLQQLLYGLQIQIELFRGDLSEQEYPAPAERLSRINEIIDSAIRLTRTLTVDLSPPVLQEEGMRSTLQWLAVQMREVFALKVEIRADDEVQIANHDLRLLLFQLVRELLFNVLKHSGVREATIEMRSENDRLAISIRDGGRGFDVDAVRLAEGTGGFGLVSVRERLLLFGGEMHIDSEPGRGTRITISIPLRANGVSTGPEGSFL